MTSQPKLRSSSPLPQTRLEAIRWYAQHLTRARDKSPAHYREARRWLGRNDLYYLLVSVLGRKDIAHRDEKGADWLFARCREVQAGKDGYLDLWSREHYKSTIITYGLTIQDILNDPEITVGIFSHTRPIAKGFLRQIKREFEANDDLKGLYDDVLWQSPAKEAPKWSEDEGIVVKRKGNPKEATVEASGLVDGQPTSKHYRLRVYDDVVTRESVTTPDQIKKTTEAWELSDNLGVEGGAARYIGTRYHLFDTYSVMLERKVVEPRIYPATDNGRVNGNPVLMSKEAWLGKCQLQSSTLAAQMLQNPLAAGEAPFKAQWLKPWEVRPRALNVYIMGDPSLGRNAESDRTAIVVIGVDGAANKYLLDGAAHRMSLSERWASLKSLHQKWSRMPGVVQVDAGWERYGLQADIEHFEERMRLENYRFAIKELAWVREGPQSKEARIERMEPDLRLGRFRLPFSTWHETHGEATWRCSVDKDGKPGDQIEYLKLQGKPRSVQSAEDAGAADIVSKPIKRSDEERRVYDLTREFIAELLPFPFGRYKDVLDAASRIYDMDIALPSAKEASADPLDVGADAIGAERVYVDGV